MQRVGKRKYPFYSDTGAYPERQKFARSNQGRRFITYTGLRRKGLRRRGRRLANYRTAGFLGIEKKFYDTSVSAVALGAPTDATGGEFDPSTTSMITTPAQGDGEQLS